MDAQVKNPTIKVIAVMVATAIKAQASDGLWAAAEKGDRAEAAIAYYKSGGTHSDKREYDQAIRDFDKAIALNPN
jgi:tetratricopeptide (TPR) repeat protein